jgi:hypothetical protein
MESRKHASAEAASVHMEEMEKVQREQPVSWTADSRHILGRAARDAERQDSDGRCSNPDDSVRVLQ